MYWLLSGFLPFRLSFVQHAALFAGQGSKEGNNDSYFKAPLPEKEICSPHEALLVLGRAVCLQAINLYREAAFLCGFVASVCAMRRANCGGQLESDWAVVSLSAYNTAVMVRFAALKLRQDQDTKIFECWDQSIRAELCLGRQEGSAFVDGAGNRRCQSTAMSRLSSRGPELGGSVSITTKQAPTSGFSGGYSNIDEEAEVKRAVEIQFENIALADRGKCPAMSRRLAHGPDEAGSPTVVTTEEAPTSDFRRGFGNLDDTGKRPVEMVDFGYKDVADGGECAAMSGTSSHDPDRAEPHDFISAQEQPFSGSSCAFHDVEKRLVEIVEL